MVTNLNEYKAEKEYVANRAFWTSVQKDYNYIVNTMSFKQYYKMLELSGPSAKYIDRAKAVLKVTKNKNLVNAALALIAKIESK